MPHENKYPFTLLTKKKLRDKILNITKSFFGHFKDYFNMSFQIECFLDLPSINLNVLLLEWGLHIALVYFHYTAQLLMEWGELAITIQ